ncbi:nucleoside hydrolase [Hoeflea prorocentri]|uniref:Nucleoside hydrolase n=1 Tax=Hoeflea prorocentri TaxID=1922333 RepID=A0A9X3ULJ9_9HYPH|nr:nucleoside hydrolase [Hoeflea prorocentri]MCY6383478.1 nucleoside hydrolase [Hoeflea prorocentri]MDA5401278.1 nucleoside hydrolase [Hoeflea prorocentri]
MNPLILDTDGGVDDAQALIMLLANGRPPSAITTCHGNVPVEQATDNILRVLALAGAEIPVYPGSVSPMAQEPINATAIHGDNGLGGIELPPARAGAQSQDAVSYLTETLMQAAGNGPVDILMIGPLTNLAHVLQAEPQAAAGIGSVIIMGGTIEGRGNITPAAEFNIYADPEAASIVFSSALDILLVPWETCARHYLTGAECDGLHGAVPETAICAFMTALTAHARRVTQGFGNPDRLRFVDQLAASVTINADIATRTLKASVAVSLEPGLTRGMTVVDPSGRLGTPKIRLVETCDLGSITEHFRSAAVLAS